MPDLVTRTSISLDCKTCVSDCPASLLFFIIKVLSTQLSLFSMLLTFLHPILSSIQTSRLSTTTTLQNLLLMSLPTYLYTARNPKVKISPHPRWHYSNISPPPFWKTSFTWTAKCHASGFLPLPHELLFLCLLPNSKCSGAQSQSLALSSADLTSKWPTVSRPKIQIWNLSRYRWYL